MTQPAAAPGAPGAPGTPNAAQQGALARDLADFLIELSIALHKNAIYPEGHPLLDGAVAGVERRLAPLVATRGSLSLGVARDQLVIEGVATDAGNPLLRELAGKLHRHCLGAVRFLPGTTRDEIGDFLRAVGEDAWRTGRPLGGSGAEALRQWPHVRLYPLSYSQLELLEEGGAGAELAEAGPGDATIGRTRAAQLWIGLARAALASELAAGEEGEGGDAEQQPPPSTDPVVVARAIDVHARDVAYDQVVVGYLLQIAEELKGKRGKEALALQKRISRLVATLRPETLRRLLDMGGDLPQRRRFVLDASQGLAVDAVVELVQAAADTSRQTISHSMVRMLSKFAHHAQHAEAAPSRSAADVALREQVQQLLSGWELDDPNPDGYRRALEGMSQAAPVLQTAEHAMPAESERLLQMSLELGTASEALDRAVDAFVARGRIGQLIELLDAAPDCTAREAAWARVATRELFRAFLADPSSERAVLERLVRRLGYAACAPLLDAVEEAAERGEGSEERGRVTELADLLAAAGPDADAAIARRLPGARRRVLRALLAVLARVGATSPAALDGAAECARHASPEVRLAAFRVLLAVEDAARRDAAVCAALDDGDPRVVRAGLRSALAHCPADAVAVLMGRADDDALPPELRSLAIRVVAASGASGVLEWLVARVTGKRRGLGALGGGVRLAPKTPDMLAALTALAERWRGDPAAEPALEAARRSADAELRLAVAARGSRPTVELSAALAEERSGGRERGS